MQTDPIEMLDHGLQTTKEEHEYLTLIGAIKCYGDYDAINCEYPKLEVIKSNGDKDIIDMGGDMYSLKMEGEKLKSEKRWNSKIKYFPRLYVDWLSKQKAASPSWE